MEALSNPRLGPFIPSLEPFITGQKHSLREIERGLGSRGWNIHHNLAACKLFIKKPPVLTAEQYGDRPRYRAFENLEDLNDPWGNEYQYVFPGEKNDDDMYDLWSYGPDEANGTADDIRNW